MLLDSLAESFFGNLLTGKGKSKGVISAGDGEIQAGKGTKEAGKKL